jgi:nitronate monooxygenase
MDLVAGGRLTAAVSGAGGFGILGGGYGRDEAWLLRELDLAGDPATYGVGFITWSMARKPRILDIMLERRPAALMLSFGDPAPHAARAHRAGITVICQVQTVAMAREAVAKGADIIVAQGAEGGGHGVSCATLPLVPAVVDAIGHKVPVVAAGGIADGRGVAAVMMLGAEGAVLGTRFYASEEAIGHPEAKRRIVTAGGDGTVRGILFDIARNNVWPAPFTGRVLQNAFSQKWLGRERELLQHIGEDAARDAGDFDTAPVIAGECAGLIDDIQPAAKIVQRIVREVAEAFARHTGVHIAPAVHRGDGIVEGRVPSFAGLSHQAEDDELEVVGCAK